QNDCDVFGNDVGLIAIAENGRIVGFNVAVGGSMGATYGEPETYPRLASIIGYTPVDKIFDICETLAAIQRDYGDRANRKHARFKYTIDDRSLDWVNDQITERLGWSLEPARDYHFDDNG